MRPMRIEHIAIWTGNLQRLQNFYSLYFQPVSGEKYTNPHTGFQSYFLTFDSGARLEIMSMPSVTAAPGKNQAMHHGLAHISFSVGSADAVNNLTRRLD
jgi:lactoylglutathione lyase